MALKQASCYMPRHTEKLIRALLQYREANVQTTVNSKITTHTHY